jgi:DNA repair protein RadC
MPHISNQFTLPLWEQNSPYSPPPALPMVRELTLAWKSPRIIAKQQVTCSTDIYNILKRLWGDTIEYVEDFYVLLLNRANVVIGIHHVSRGGVAGTVADPKVIMQGALKSNASSLVLAHNHPSGNLKPSSADISLTKKLKQAGEFLDLPVLDHVILTSESYYSFADEGIL